MKDTKTLKLEIFKRCIICIVYLRTMRQKSEQWNTLTEKDFNLYLKAKKCTFIYLRLK